MHFHERMNFQDARLPKSPNLNVSTDQARQPARTGSNHVLAWSSLQWSKRSCSLENQYPHLEGVDLVYTAFSSAWLSCAVDGDWVTHSTPYGCAPYVLRIFRPAGRLFTGPRPPTTLAECVLAAVIRPPLLFLPYRFFCLLVCLMSRFRLRSSCPHGAGIVMVLASIVTAPIRASALPSSVAPVASEMD